MYVPSQCENRVAVKFFNCPIKIFKNKTWRTLKLEAAALLCYGTFFYNVAVFPFSKIERERNLMRSFSDRPNM